MIRTLITIPLLFLLNRLNSFSQLCPIKIKKISYQLLLANLIFVSLSGLALAETWYVRTDGGNNTQCTGKADLPYPGTGSNQNCAFEHPFWVIGVIGVDSLIKGGDTLILGPGQYKIGYGAPNTPVCRTDYPYDCVMHNIPSGIDSNNKTRILGAGWDKGCKNPPQLWGNERASRILSLVGSSNVEVQCLDITDHSDCTWYGVAAPTACPRGKYPYGAYADYGILASDSSNVLLKNLNIHGLHIGGIQAARIKDWVIEDSKITANSLVGWDGDIQGDDKNEGTISFIKTAITYNGCGETYPDLKPYNCFGQVAGGYGDGIGVGLNTTAHWLFDQANISHNTSDGIDLLYGDGSGLVTVRNSLMEGNAGNQLKTSQPTKVENSIIIGNCDYFAKERPDLNYAVDHCRAAGNTVSFNYSAGMKTYIYNSTITGNGDVLVLTSGFHSNCNGTESTTIKNSLLQGGIEFHTGEAVDLYFNSGATGNGDGNCGNIPVTYSNLVVDHIKKGVCPQGQNILCQDPLLMGSWQDAKWDVRLKDNSPAINAADESVPVTNSLDFEGKDRGDSWDIGAIQATGAPQNKPPVVNDLNVNLSEDTSVDLTLSGSDPDGQIVRYTVVSSPAQGVLSGTAPNLRYSPKANFFGLDQFTFAAEDNNGAIRSAKVTLNVVAVNDSPIVMLNADVMTGKPPLVVNFDGSGSYSPDGALKAINWDFGDKSFFSGGLKTEHTFSQPGQFNVTLQITDNQNVSLSKSILITVGAENLKPIVNAGNDQTISLPQNTINLNATVSDDNQPTASSLNLLWNKVSGPGFVNFTQSSLASTTASFGQAGIYVLRMTASDGALTSSDDVTVTVLDPTLNCDYVPFGSFNGCYYNDSSLTNLKVVRNEPAVNFNWGTSSPNSLLPADYFSARFQGKMSFEAGRYQFTVTADDGVRLYVDNQLIINQWKDQPPTTYSKEIDLSGGEHLIKVEYYEKGGGAVMSLNWKKVATVSNPSSTPQPTSSSTDEVRYLIQAETANNLVRPFEIVDDGLADKGLFIFVPNGNGNSTRPGKVLASYTVDVKKAGTYVLWGRVIASSGNDDSFFVQIDNGTDNLWDIQNGAAWHWDQVRNRGGENPVKVNLSAGVHTITIKHREDGVKLDSLLLTSDLNMVP